MKKIKTKSALLALLASGALFGNTAKAQLINSDFSGGLNDWTVQGTNTRVPFGYNLTPKDLGTVPGQVTFGPGNVAIIHSEDPGPLVATGLSQTFQLNLPTYTKGSGRLQLKSGSIHLNFNWQALSNESPGAPYDYVRGELNGQQLFVNDLRNSNDNNPGAYGFFRSSTVQSFDKEINGLLGKTSTLAFFASDTIDGEVDSALAISNLKIVFHNVILQDVDAINSVYSSGLPMALAQREILLNVASNANRDVNGRLFRLRAEADLRPEGSAGPSGDGKDVKESKKEIIPEEKRWSFFATGAYGYRDQNNVDLAAGFTSNVFTASIGGEYKITPALTVGIAASRIEADNDLGSIGSANIEGWSFDGYVSYAANHFYADLLYALGTYSNHINRDTIFGTATASPDSLTNTVQFNTGYNIPCGRLLTGPIAGLTWVHGDVDGYSENQAGAANLTVPDQHVDSLTSELGWQLSVPIHTGLGTITPQAHASWVHEYLDTAKTITVGLNNSPYYALNSTGTSLSRTGGFNASGGTSAAGSDYLGVGAGVAFEISDRAAVILDWETRFFQDHASTQNVALTGQIKF
ncbi:MAG TPA: autotransporter outer membrane beta-barrel domain-containing protein [Chthoniobacter sp.]|nr:autotransporter outer membrane beta-barrel domain-containing protein [Chthoniobacter sp.]